MKVLIKLDSNVYVVEGVSVDDRCLPLVAGSPPYHDIPSQDTSPFVTESALWFKTLALEAIYIDCNQRLVYWLPLASLQVSQKWTSPPKRLGTNEFIPPSAKPLFLDNNVYDFDPSFKEMMMKCCEVTRKFLNKYLSTLDFHKSVAKILHIYILPSITFTRSDMFSLSQAKFQIETRLTKAETDIKKSASVAENVRACLNRMAKAIMNKENMESETHLRNCKKDFLVAFLKVITFCIENFNVELSSAQNKVNWAKDHVDCAVRLADLKERRDKLFLEVDEFIRVRETIKNVILRRDLTKRKIKKCQIINNCMHSMFVEIVRKLESEDLILYELGSDKVSICAAREAVLCTISDVSHINHKLSSSTKFESQNFVHYSVLETRKIDKNVDWMTLEERVDKLLKDRLSVAGRCHEYNCKTITDEIHATLEALQVVKEEAGKFLDLHDSSTTDDNVQFGVVIPGTMNKSSTATGISHSKKVVPSEAGALWDFSLQQKMINTRQMETMEVPQMQFALDNDDCHVVAVDRTVIQTPNTAVIREDSESNTASIHEDCQCEVPDEGFSETRHRPQQNNKLTSACDVLSADNLPPSGELARSDRSSDFRRERSQKTQQNVLNKQLSMCNLLNSVENLKDLIQEHYTEIILCLDEELDKETSYETSFQERQELLWKSYEHFFCQTLYLPLIELYTSSLTSSTRQAYSTLRSITLQQILQDDKLLDLFFGHTSTSSIAAPISITCLRQSEIRPVSSPCVDSACCYVNNQYMLAAVDGNPRQRRFDLDSTDTDVVDAKALNHESFLSSIDEGFGASSSSFSSSVRSDFTVGSLDGDIVDACARCTLLSSPDTDDEILGAVLSPFRMYVSKCLDAACFLDKVRFLTKGVEGLVNDISALIGPNYKSNSDDIISMLVLSLYNLSENMFVDLYVTVRLLMDVLPNFLSGSVWDFHLVSLCASFNYLFTLRMCEHEVKCCPEHGR